MPSGCCNQSPLTGGLLSRLAAAPKPAAALRPRPPPAAALGQVQDVRVLARNRPRSQTSRRHQGARKATVKGCPSTAPNALADTCRPTPCLMAAPGTTAPASQSRRRMRVMPPVRARRTRARSKKFRRSQSRRSGCAAPAAVRGSCRRRYLMGSKSVRVFKTGDVVLPEVTTGARRRH